MKLFREYNSIRFHHYAKKFRIDIRLGHSWFDDWDGYNDRPGDVRTHSLGITINNVFLGFQYYGVNPDTWDKK
jgi:hypothetical protein